MPTLLTVQTESSSGRKYVTLPSDLGKAFTLSYGDSNHPSDVKIDHSFVGEFGLALLKTNPQNEIIEIPLDLNPNPVLNRGFKYWHFESKAGFSFAQRRLYFQIPSDISGGNTQRYVHLQSTANTEWLISHPLGKYPDSVKVIRPNNTVSSLYIEEYISLNKIKLTFGIPLSGKAIII